MQRNKKLLTLKQILDKYLEMKDKEAKQDQLLKELQETNKMLLRIISHLEAPDRMLHGGHLSEVASSNGDPQLYMHPGDQQEEVGAEMAHLDYASGMHQAPHQYQNHNENGQQSLPLAEAYQRMMADPKVAEAIAATLNQVITSRQTTEKDHTGNDDSMYEQVLESDVMAQLIEQMLPPVDNPDAYGQSSSIHSHMPMQHHNMSSNAPATPGALDMQQFSGMPLYEYSEASNGSHMLSSSAPISHYESAPSEHEEDQKGNFALHASEHIPTTPHPTSSHTNHETSSSGHRKTRRSPQRGQQKHSRIPLTPNTHGAASPLTPISPLLPSPHPNLSIRTISSHSTGTTFGPVTPQQGVTTRNSDGKSRHGDSSKDAPHAKKRKDK